jgi:hypothetical protein
LALTPSGGRSDRLYIKVVPRRIRFPDATNLGDNGIPGHALFPHEFLGSANGWTFVTFTPENHRHLSFTFPHQA